MNIVYERCVGIDVHKRNVVVCAITPDTQGQRHKEQRTFSTMMPDLLRMRQWFQSLNVTHVAMESTGSFWKPIFNVLEGHMEVLVVNAQHLKAVPGRKTDLKDAEWIADLLQHGLLRPSFVPLLSNGNCANLPGIGPASSKNVPAQSIACKRFWKIPISSSRRSQVI